MEKMYINAYYHDPDHPTGIVLIEIYKPDFSKYKYLKMLYNEFKINNFKRVDGYYYEIEQNDPDFSNMIVAEITAVCNENKAIAKDSGWNDFIELKYMGWIRIEFALNKNELYNDGFWRLD